MCVTRTVGELSNTSGGWFGGPDAPCGSPAHNAMGVTLGEGRVLDAASGDYRCADIARMVGIGPATLYRVIQAH